ncbi:beta-ketoacyl-[acyl-carrier-protein] synthase family protein [Millisia brevis]|uniref:beta-ketoacyl-[acyl-carrier-protein] synthase family protein n=1 Tax=Millisia brevis TaxID=264148 RepID=UPI000833E591|nr:beta-ketoacyl-[acyl-carrier-protein] synthase family protein [Millisia brevis]
MRTNGTEDQRADGARARTDRSSGYAAAGCERVSVVSVGAITSQGPTAKDLWDGVVHGRVAIREVEHLDMSGFRTAIAGEVQAVPRLSDTIGYPAAASDRAYDFVLSAAEEAMGAVTASGVVDVRESIDPTRWGVVIGTCNAGLLSARSWYVGRREGRAVDPRVLTYVTPQAIAEAVAGVYGLQGPVLSLNTACAAGANALGHAADLIRWGQADAILAGGTDALSDVLVAGFNALESLSPRPAAPYSRNREGLSLGEGSGMVVLMRSDLAARFALPHIAEIAALGLSADGYHPTAPRPDGSGASRAIGAAVDAAAIGTAEVGYVNGHGTGTPKNDAAETLAMRRAFGADADDIAVSSTKSMIGHLLGAAGAVEAIVTARALAEQVVPPTANYGEVDPVCDLDYVPNDSRPMSASVAVSNNFAFGGANATLVLTDGTTTAPAVETAEQVVITGIGALSSAGEGIDAALDAVLHRRSTTVAVGDDRIGRVPFDPARIPAKVRRRMDRPAMLSLVTARAALDDAGIDVPADGGTTIDAERIGTVLGTGIGPMEAMEAFAAPLFDRGPTAASPAVFPNTVYNAATGQVCMNLGTVGPTTTVTTGHTAGGAAIVYAADLLGRGRADAMLAIGVDTLTDTVIDAYRDLGLTGARGYALSEAAVSLVLERSADARRRGAPILARLLGHAIASDGLGVARTDVTGAGVARAIRSALDAAGVAADEVVAVYSAASGVAAADRGEAAALADVFGATPPPIVDPQALLGVPMGVGPAVSVAVAAASWRRWDALGPTVILGDSGGGTHLALVIAPATGETAVSA